MHLQGLKNEYYHDGERFNMRAFWADHKPILPIHYGVYVAEVGCLKAAAANVETVFSGAGIPLCRIPALIARQCPCVYAHTPPACVHVAGKFAQEAKSVGRTTLKRMVKCHYNFKYPFLRPTNMQVNRCSPSLRPHTQPRP